MVMPVGLLNFQWLFIVVVDVGTDSIAERSQAE
jgi:hypothetical protein